MIRAAPCHCFNSTAEPGAHTSRDWIYQAEHRLERAVTPPLLLQRRSPRAAATQGKEHEHGHALQLHPSLNCRCLQGHGARRSCCLLATATSSAVSQRPVGFFCCQTFTSAAGKDPKRGRRILLMMRQEIRSEGRKESRDLLKASSTSASVVLDV